MHKHEWKRGKVAMGKHRHKELSPRDGAVCACGLVALPPTRADKRAEWARKMDNPALAVA